MKTHIDDNIIPGRYKGDQILVLGWLQRCVDCTTQNFNPRLYAMTSDPYLSTFARTLTLGRFASLGYFLNIRCPGLV